MVVETTPQDHVDESGANDMMSEGSPSAEFILGLLPRIEKAPELRTPSTGDPHYISDEQQSMGD